MKTKRSELGELGENIACLYLEKIGYKILERNYRKPWGEIDIIARAKDKTLVFVEVKTVSVGSEKIPTAEDQMTSVKIHKFKRTAQLFTGERRDLVNEKKGWRLDMIAITLPQGELNNSVDEFLNIAKINYYENI